ncbi:gamma-mobile-trio protein GmtX [Marinobacter nauticus]|uniref:gamma-mobile-trio protein GmtX n=1 Tax=Marinobacter nauticus TaxID=2743 RepID=UPI0035199606
MSEPREVYEAILGQLKSSRSRRSLEALYGVCKEHYEAGAVDFRIATIAKSGASRGVPSAQTIRNKTGEPYRAVIEAWQKLGRQKKKAIKARTAPSGEYDWVDEVNNKTHRFLILDLISKVRKLRSENKRFASIKKLEIDYRAGAEEESESRLPSLLSHEIDALKDAISEDSLKVRGWTKTERGSIKDQNGKVLLRNGFVDGIEKMLSLDISSKE